MNRHGILAGGNFIIDHVKMIDAWPPQDMLANILSETSSNGGGPYNVLKDLAVMQVAYPLAAAGLVGRDASGDWIRNDCAAAGIDTTQLHQTEHAPTSYTDAMTVQGTGRRTFFHQRGANAMLGEEHFDFSRTQAKHFHLGYLMLLDEMDRLDAPGHTVAAKVLAAAQRAGLITSVDIVSTDHPQFREVTEAALPHTDHLIINEVEAGKVAGISLRDESNINLDACIAAAQHLLGEGVRRQVIIHFVEGAISVSAQGRITRQGSLLLPEGFVVGATGAGDAFAAGCLHGLHEDWSLGECLRLGVCSAAACLTHGTPSRGLRPMPECLALVSQHPVRDLG